MRRTFQRLRSAASRWSTPAAIACSVAAIEIGSRIGLPGVDGERLQRFLGGAEATLLSLYNLLAGGGTARGAVLALGVLPYVQARVYLWLAQLASPRVRQALMSDRKRRWTTRLLTLGVGAVQSFGFAQFLNGIPGVVAEPGFAFVARTVLLTTGGAAAIGWLAERLFDASSHEADIDASASRASAIPQAEAVRELPAPVPVLTPRDLGVKRDRV